MSIQLSKFIRTELLTTEETYLSHLMTIKNVRKEIKKFINFFIHKI